VKKRVEGNEREGEQRDFVNAAISAGDNAVGAQRPLCVTMDECRAAPALCRPIGYHANTIRCKDRVQRLRRQDKDCLSSAPAVNGLASEWSERLHWRALALRGEDDSRKGERRKTVGFCLITVDDREFAFPAFIVALCGFQGNKPRHGFGVTFA